MADLNGNDVDDTFGNLLQVPNSGAGVDATLRQVQDARGDNSALHLSTTQVGAEDGSVSAPGLTFGDDSDNGFYRIGNDNWAMAIAGVNAVELDTTGLVINEGAANRDFRIESQSETNSLYLDASAGTWFINDSSAANTAIGLVINQTDESSRIMEFKGANITHALTGQEETDTWGSMRQVNSNGGMNITAVAEAASSLGMTLRAFTGDATTTLNSGTQGILDCYVAEHDGAGSLQACSANAAMHTFRGQNAGGNNRTLLIIDEDGDLHVDGSSSLTTYDDEDDIDLLRTFQLTVAKKGIVRSEFDRFVKSHYQDLVRIGILSKVTEKERLQGLDPVINITRLQQLEIGAIGQLANRVRRLEQLHAS